MKKIFYVSLIFSTALMAMPVKAANLSAGDLIKASQPAVYYYGADGKRYVFPNEKTYNTWYSDFSSVKTITDAELAALSIGGNATYKPGVKMVKITTDPKVYAVASGGTLRWVKSESLAVSLYGSDWSKKVEDIPDAFFTNYKVGADITVSTDFIVVNETALYSTIDLDKGLSVTTTSEKKYVWNKATTNNDSYTHNNLDFVNYNGGYLATWNDDRHGQQEIFYQKTNSDGSAEGSAVRISGNISDSKNAKAYYDGSNIYVFWEDYTSSRSAIYLQKRDIYGNKLSQRVFASTTYAASKYPDIAYNSTLGEYGVAWWDSRSALNTTKGDIYFTRMKNGLKTGDSLRVSATSTGEYAPRIAVMVEKFGVVWQDDDYYIKFALIDKNSALVGSIKDVAMASKAVKPSIVSDGQNFLIAWTDKSGSADDLYYILLDAGGNKVAEAKTVATNVGGALEPDVLWTGSKFYISYTGITVEDIYLVKMDANGNVSEKDINISNTAEDSYSSKLAITDQGAIAVTWLEDSGTTNKILSAVETAN